MHPLLKSHILFYSNGLAIQHGLPKNGNVKVNNEFSQNASSPEALQFVL